MNNQEGVPCDEGLDRAMQFNNLFNRLISQNYKSAKFGKKDSELEDDLNKMFEGLLWAEKKNPEILFQLFEMESLQQIGHLHLLGHELAFLKNYILIMMNSCEGGLLNQFLLQHRLPHTVMQGYLKSIRGRAEDQESIEYLGSFLKAYHRTFLPQNLSLFILEEGYFELLEISFKFFNCPEPLTSTTVFNIVLALLRYPEVKEFILLNKARRPYYQQIFDSLTNLFRNELISFGLRIGHVGSNDDVDTILSEVEDKIALWEDISTSMEGLQQIFMLSFSKNVILPLLIGPLLNGTQIPIFTLKFSLFLIRKLLPTIQKFGLLDVMLRMLLIEDNVYFWPQSLCKAMLPPFKIEKLLMSPVAEEEEQEQKQAYGPGIKDFYYGVFRSKDNLFILMATSLLSSIANYLPKHPDIAEDCKMLPGHSIHVKLSEMMANQLSEIHSLNTMASILNTLVMLSQGSKLDNDLQNRFIYVFKSVIKEVQDDVKAHNRYWDVLIETTEEDLGYVEDLKLGQNDFIKKNEDLFKIVFTWDPNEENEVQELFYCNIPDTPSDYIRYNFAKFVLFRKAALRLVDTKLPRLIEDYYSTLITKSPYISGDVFRLAQIKGPFAECEIVEEKSAIPAIWIFDDNFFVIAHLNRARKEAKIIASVKYKHLIAQQITKKDRVFLEVSMRYWNHKKERYCNHQETLRIKGTEGAMKIIGKQRELNREKQLCFISRALKTAEESMPDISLI